MAADAPRTPQQRKQDTLARLDRDLDAWVASADRDGNAHLVPLSFLWDGVTLTLATTESSPTARNLRASGRVRMSVGTTRDVVLIDGTVETFSRVTVPVDLADAFAAKLWDARVGTTPYAYLRVTPRRIQAWREENELAGRDLMRAGQWLV
ncbi:pyridoxamine 5'-phosphate oxidase family protein [Micromonospora sp. NPDC048839]|uniref:pyridoxamine 5'-phosphate oxidase family protein n=1 Tax=Micromonospora sp. NPDC048839 TaxID=3155641 RepID=UPI003411B0BC